MEKEISCIDSNTFPGSFQLLCLSDKNNPEISHMSFVKLKNHYKIEKSAKKFELPPFKARINLDNPEKPKSNAKPENFHQTTLNIVKPKPEIPVKQEIFPAQKPQISSKNQSNVE